jgi:NAD(P)-dependent dehydrogenase (short-subunit alcohol dehydrogenase family)
MNSLGGKVAIVTGGSRGIGRAMVERFLEEGASVVAASRNTPGKPLAHHERLLFLATDAVRSSDVERLVSRCVDQFGGLDILVNNAGIQLQKSIEATTEEEWDDVLAVNVKSMFLCTRAAIPHMRRRGRGSIVNVGSYDGFVADPNFTAYCASKGAVHAFTRAAAVDLGKDGIRCNVICPGYIETEMLEDYYAHLSDPAAARASIARLHPVGRTGRPKDIANLALWLASDESSFITGQQFVADGGFTACAPQP